MPFDLNATTHVFTKTRTGGIQKVVAKRSDDTAQIKLIRQHLQEITQQFARRDFSGPGQIHGHEMPGLARLKAANPGELQLKYRDTEAGGTIVYETKNSQVLAALHQWFDAQVSDHGQDAMEGHDHATMRH
ncbi:MAG: aspartate carbamoyltransferase [Herminiimonas sp.]|nr:aspartate carbamoyltransferase [Herminiimonas sp.]